MLTSSWQLFHMRHSNVLSIHVKKCLCTDVCLRLWASWKKPCKILLRKQFSNISNFQFGGSCEQLWIMVSSSLLTSLICRKGLTPCHFHNPRGLTTAMFSICGCPWAFKSFMEANTTVFLVKHRVMGSHDPCCNSGPDSLLSVCNSGSRC